MFTAQHETMMDLGKHALLHPTFQGDHIPFTFTVFQGNSPLDVPKGMSPLPGDIFIALTTLYVFSGNKWERWIPTKPHRVLLRDGGIFFAPCKCQGIQLLCDNAQYENCIEETKHALGLTTEASLMCAHIVDLIIETLWPNQGADVTALHGAIQATDGPSENTEESVTTITCGITCPGGTSSLEWKSLGIETYVPWFSPVDQKAVQYMLASITVEDYRYGDGYQMVIAFQYDEESGAIGELAKKIEHALSHGSAVIVHGWEPCPCLEFSTQDISLIKPMLGQEMRESVLCSRSRAGT
ncbi:hypothetical protein EDC04DRAFT_2609874 [Pisolithus marmoratus]|nr:hypothetical protein EDC04DRAFT_2609874 [Pisolithus marmoratus]